MHLGASKLEAGVRHLKPGPPGTQDLSWHLAPSSMIVKGHFILKFKWAGIVGI